MGYDVNEIKRLIESLEPKEGIDPNILSIYNIMLSPEHLKRIAATVSILPKSPGPGSRIVDIGGTAYWIPLYTKLLGYDRITIVERPGGAFFSDF